MGSAAVSKTSQPLGGSSHWRKDSPDWPTFQALSKITGQGFAVRAWIRTANDREWIIYSTANLEELEALAHRNFSAGRHR